MPRLNTAPLVVRQTLIITVVVACGVKPGFADVTLIQRIVQDARRPGATFGRTAGVYPSSAFYKGNRFRWESKKWVLLRNGMTGAVYALSPASKTYRPLDVDRRGVKSRGVETQVREVVLTPGTTTRQILGYPARNWRYRVVLSRVLPASVAARSAPRAARLAAAGTAAFGPVALPRLVIEGDAWVTNATAPAGMTGATLALLTGQVPCLESLKQKFSRMKGIPLEMTCVVGELAVGGASQRRREKQYSVSTIAVRKTPLPNTLFGVPAGYTDSAGQNRLCQTRF